MGTPDEIWSAVLELITDKPVLSWAANLRLERVEGGNVHLSVRPGHRDLLRFAQQQRERLAELMRGLLKRPVRVEITAASGDAITADGGSATTPVPAVRDTDTLSQQEAMSLPLVRQVFEHYDVALVDARKRKPDEHA